MDWHDETPLDDRAILLESCAHPRRFEELFDRHFATIHRYLARRCGADAADDLASETFLVAYSKRTDFDPDRGQVLPWLYGIAANLLRNQQRKQVRDMTPPAVLYAIDTAPAPDDEAVSAADARARYLDLLPGLRALSADDLETVLLYAWEDLSYPEIAAALEVPVGTVRSRLNRVRRKLNDPSPAEQDDNV